MEPASKRLQCIAHHEAGHAVAAWSVGMKPRSISIVSDDVSEGMFLHRPFFRSLPAGWEFSLPPRAQRKLEDRTLVALAGGAAQRRFDPGGFQWSDCKGDHDQVTQMIMHLTDGDLGEEFSAYWKLIEIRASNFVARPDNWRVIRSVARALVKRRTLAGPELIRVIEGRFEEAGGP